MFGYLSLGSLSLGAYMCPIKFILPLHYCAVLLLRMDPAGFQEQSTTDIPRCLKSSFATRQGISKQTRQTMQKRNPQKVRRLAFSIIVLTMIISRRLLCIRQCVDPSLFLFFLNDHLLSKAEMSHTFNPKLGRQKQVDLSWRPA